MYIAYLEVCSLRVDSLEKCKPIVLFMSQKFHNLTQLSVNFYELWSEFYYKYWYLKFFLCINKVTQVNLIKTNKRAL